MKTLLHKGPSTSRQWFLMLSIAFGLFSLLSVVVLSTFLSSTSHHHTSALSLSLQSASTGLDPNFLEDPMSYDTRPCAKIPSTDNCNGKYPITPPRISPLIGRENGSGACIDNASRIVEDQSIADSTGNNVADLQLFWLPTCQSYYSSLSFTFPLSEVQHLSIRTQTEIYGWFQQISQLPPLALDTEQTGPIQGSELVEQQLSSPLIYSPTTPVSASINMQLADGSLLGNFTSSYSAGIKAYTA